VRSVEREENSSGVPVSEKKEFDRTWAESRVSEALRRITANLLRIVRGAGSPSDVLNQTISLREAFDEYRQAFGHWPPSSDVGEMLSVDRGEEWRRRVDDPQVIHEGAIDWIAQGALQFTASRLIGQPAQENAGKTEMLSGIAALEKARKEMIQQKGSLAANAEGPKNRSTPMHSKRKGAGQRRPSSPGTSTATQ
jgi:hypothetical protein